VHSEAAVQEGQAAQATNADETVKNANNNIDGKQDNAPTQDNGQGEAKGEGEKKHTDSAAASPKGKAPKGPMEIVLMANGKEIVLNGEIPEEILQQMSPEDREKVLDMLEKSVGLLGSNSAGGHGDGSGAEYDDETEKEKAILDQLELDLVEEKALNATQKQQLRALAEDGVLRAQSLMGYSYEHRYAFGRNISIGLEWYKKAAMRGDPPAQVRLSQRARARVWAPTAAAGAM